MEIIEMNTNININNFKSQFINWYNNDCYNTCKYNYTSFEDCYNDIDVDEYEMIVENFCDEYNYNAYDIYEIIAHNIMNWH